MSFYSEARKTIASIVLIGFLLFCIGFICGGMGFLAHDVFGGGLRGSIGLLVTAGGLALYYPLLMWSLEVLDDTEGG